MGDTPESQRVNSPEAVREMIVKHQIERGNWSRSTETAKVPAKTLMMTLSSGPREKIIEAAIEDGFKEVFWQLREAYRLAYKEYASLAYPCNSRDEERLHNYLHGDWTKFVHLSKDEPLYIAYTPDANYGKGDRRVKTTVGRFLKKYYPELSDADIRKLVDIHRYYFGVDDVKFATTPEEIERVYCSIHSCMGHPWSNNSQNYGSQVHPSHAYATPDFKLAYMEREGKINARCLTWINPEDATDKRYIRGYGDEVLIRKLQSMGYVGKNLNGAKMNKIQAIAQDGRVLHDTYVVPYVDDIYTGDRDAQHVFVGDDHLLIINKDRGREGYKYLGRANRTNGLLGINCDYMRYNNAKFGVRNPDGSRELSPYEEANSKTCHCCGTKVVKNSDNIYRANTLETSESGEIWICRDCVGDGKEYVRAYNERGNQVIDRRENCVKLVGDDIWVVNKESVFSSIGVMKLSEKYYPGGQYAWDHMSRDLNGERVVSGDVFYDYWEDQVYHISERVRTHRGVLLSKGATTLKPGLFFDAGNGWVRSVPKGKDDVRFEPLRDWLIGLAAVNTPRKRAGALKKALKGETDPAVAEMLLEVMKKILVEEGREKLINDASQGELPGVAEVA